MLTADLRKPVANRDLGPHWGRLSTILTECVDAVASVREALAGRTGLRVVDAGCGNGYMALELARDGHSVCGFDPSRERIEIARNALEGDLRYVVAHMNEWEPEPGSCDVVIFHQSLHHMPGLDASIAKVRAALAPAGVVIATEHGYDQLDANGAEWICESTRLLHAAGLCRPPEQSAEELRREWMEEGRTERMHAYDRLVSALRGAFAERSFRTIPFLHFFVADALDSDDVEREIAVIRALAAQEERFIERGMLPAVAFRFVGGRGR